MKRSLFALATALAVASTADAVSVTIVPDQASYLPGDTITLGVVVDTTGAQDEAIFGRVIYDPLIMTGGSSVQFPLTALAGLQWILASIVTCGGGSCDAFNQIFTLPVFVDQPPGFQIATLTFTAGAPGTTNVFWDLAGGFDFFGLSSPQGASVTVTPEPATAVLLALGLAALRLRTTHTTKGESDEAHSLRARVRTVCHVRRSRRVRRDRGGSGVISAR